LWSSPSKAIAQRPRPRSDAALSICLRRLGVKSGRAIATGRRSMSETPLRADRICRARRSVDRSARKVARSVEIVRVRLSRRLDAERLGDGGDLGALALDRGDELLCPAARWRLSGRIELVVDGLVVGHRDDVGTDAFTQ